MGGNLFASTISHLEATNRSSNDEQQFVDTCFFFLLYIKELIFIYSIPRKDGTTSLHSVRCSNAPLILINFD